MEKYLEIGEIVNTHGIKGELKVVPLTDDVRRYDKLEWVYIDMKKYFIESVRYHKQFVLLKLKGIDNMNEAILLKNNFIKIPRELAIKLPEGAHFICDIIGCMAKEQDGKVLGKIVDVLKTGSNDVYVVKRDNKKDVLIPVIKDVVKDIDVDNKIIIVKLLEGLVDDED